MKDALLVYLHDHLAGAQFGIELVEALTHDHSDNELGRAALAWEREIKADQAVLRDITNRLGASPGTFKEAISWIGEKVARIKLHRQNHSDLGTLETLETLALGIVGKEKLWRALETAAAGDSRLAGIDLMALGKRAREQHHSVEAHRVQLAGRVFTNCDPGGHQVDKN
jgi:hypothetical protein